MVEKIAPMGGVWGWRGVLGYISPAVMTWLGEYFYRYAPEGVGLMVATMGVDRVMDENLEEALTELDKAARRLVEGGANSVHLPGPFGFIGGVDRRGQLLKRLEEVTKLPSTTGLTSIPEAFDALSVKKLILCFAGSHIWPERYKKFLENDGFEVVNTKNLEVLTNSERRKLPMNVQYNLAREAYLETPEAEGILLPSGAFGGPPVVEHLEMDCGIPVVTEYSVFLWAGLRALKIKAPVRGFGRLFETL